MTTMAPGSGPDGSPPPPTSDPTWGPTITLGDYRVPVIAVALAVLLLWSWK